ncbi:hypothetical protein [Clostridium sporogenes]|nr:hypothetical protein [Clostridium sporogenes]
MDIVALYSNFKEDESIRASSHQIKDLVCYQYRIFVLTLSLT